jgi:hypothetical protein
VSEKREDASETATEILLFIEGLSGITSTLIDNLMKRFI